MSQPFTGSLQVKKKAELQQIAVALGVPDTGTREEIQLRIKRHLDENTSDLEADPTFAGLYSRKRQRSVQPAPQTPAARTRRAAADKLETVEESESSTEETNEVAVELPRAPLSPLKSAAGAPLSPEKLRTPLKPVTTTAVANSKPSSPRSQPQTPHAAQQAAQTTATPSRNFFADAITQPDLQAVVAMERNAVTQFVQAVRWNRVILSNGRAIFFIGAFFEFAYIILAIHKFEHFPILPITVQAEPALRVTVYAALSWAIPTLLLPLVVGYLVSFSSPTTLTFDVLSASIIRAAANIAFHFPAIAVAGLEDEGKSLDVIGSKWRVLSASVALAFAFAEAISNRRLVSTVEAEKHKNN